MTGVVGRSGRRVRSREDPPSPCPKCSGARVWTALHRAPFGLAARCMPCHRAAPSESTVERHARVDRVAKSLPCPTHRTPAGVRCVADGVCSDRREAALALARSFEVRT